MRGEFDFIGNLKKRYDLNVVGDDCAVLPQNDDVDLLVTADMLVEDIDFRLEWSTPEMLGHKALAVSVSDIAAMGGLPKWSLTSIGVPEKIWNSEFIDRFYNGWHSLADSLDVALIGGDVSRTPDRFVVDSIVGGNVAAGKAILRSGAKPGDAIFITGRLGGAAAGLRLLEQEIRVDDCTDWQRRLIRRQLAPLPKVAEGRVILKNGLASAMIDISDGLSSDLQHICKASGVGAVIDAAAVPVDHDSKKFTESNEQQLDLALNGGEDFELLFTVPKEKISELDLQQFSRIGTVTANVGIVELTTASETTVLHSSGYRHF